MLYTFFRNDYAIENLNYAVTLLIALYTFIKIVFLDKIKFINNKASRRKNINYNTHYSGSTNSSSNRNSDDYYYDYDYYNYKYNFFKNKKFKINNDFDKKEIYEKRFTNGNDRVIDENGIEKYVWEYANDYEREQRAEEDRKFLEEQNLYNNYYNNDDSYNYDPYSDDNSYGGNSWSDNDSYYNNDDWF